jgi:hypothetical protein
MSKTRERQGFISHCFDCICTVFIGMQHIGGNSDLQALHQAGQLQGLLDNASSRHA